jgi:hypothetical protein
MGKTFKDRKDQKIKKNKAGPRRGPKGGHSNILREVEKLRSEEEE